MHKDVSYYRSVVQYNEELAKFSAELADRLEDPVVAKWARAVSKQHEVHLRRHRRLLSRAESTQSSPESSAAETPPQPIEQEEVCPDEAFHQDSTGYFDAQGHHITEERWNELQQNNEVVA